VSKGQGLTPEDFKAMLSGFQAAGFPCLETPSKLRNPIKLEWHVGGQVRRYRLWTFEVKKGGGKSDSRPADERRIQVSSGPQKSADLESDGYQDLLMGFETEAKIAVAYDRRWLEEFIKKREIGAEDAAEAGAGDSEEQEDDEGDDEADDSDDSSTDSEEAGAAEAATGVKTKKRQSPSAQFKVVELTNAQNEGIHHFTKKARLFDTGHIATIRPDMLPAYLLNYTQVLNGSMSATQAEEAFSATTATTNVKNVVEYCAARGYSFDPDLVARYIASLLTKPFVILAGVSGTGKSKLAELVAEFYTRSLPGSASPSPKEGEQFVFGPPSSASDPLRFALVPVRPDWIDNQSILGFVNPITSRYESTQSLDIILRAKQALDGATSAPRYFMLLDEMNLSRIEHYFSDWLACTESRRSENGAIVQKSVPLHRSDADMKTFVSQNGAAEEMDVPAAIDLPTNLIVTGTVNVDETTYAFSPKVLDRAMVLEFDDVDLDRLRDGGVAAGAGDYRFPEALRPFALAGAKEYGVLPEATHEHMKAINGILEGARLHLGYRAANEMALFMAIFNEILPLDETDSDWRRALDAAVLQKVLPRIAGNRSKLELPLWRLCSYLRDATRPESNQLVPLDTGAVAVFPKSYRRAAEMLSSLQEFGFVTFFK
jgi:hypothetical protein